MNCEFQYTFTTFLDRTHIIIAYISSKISDDLLDSDFVIRKQSNDFIGTGLTVDSVIKLHKILTIPKSIISRKLGTVNPSVQSEIKRKLRQMFEKE
jgi:mRNA interferase MazF